LKNSTYDWISNATQDIYFHKHNTLPVWHTPKYTPRRAGLGAYGCQIAAEILTTRRCIPVDALPPALAEGWKRVVNSRIHFSPVSKR
jgi:hypothetical protein